MTPAADRVRTTRPNCSHAAAVAAFAFVLLASAHAGAQDTPRTLTMEQALQAALRQHPSLQRESALIGAAASRARQARAGMLPSVALQGTATDGPLGAPAFGALGNPANFGAPPLSVQGMAGDPVKRQFGGGLNITQTVLDFGRTQHLVAARRGLLHAAEEDAETQKAAVLVSVQEAYLNVLRAQQLAAIQQENLRQRETTVAQAQLFVEGQLKAGVDLQTARANASEARIGLIAAQNEVRYAFAALNNAMGATAMTEYRLAPTDSAAAATAVRPDTLEEATRRALAQRPEVASASLQRQAAEQTVRGVKSELMPRLDAIASLGAVNPSGVIHNSKDYAVGLALSIPLYTGGLVEGRVEEERRKRDALLAQERETAETVRLQTARAWLDVQTRVSQESAAREQVTAAAASLELATERYRLQLSTLVELTDAEAAAIRARAFLANAQFDLQQARALLDWATGETYRRYARPRK
jgi:outer membrane protein